jgi:hypothetical protein
MNGIGLRGHLPASPIASLRILSVVEQKFKVVHTFGCGQEPGAAFEVGQGGANGLLPGLLERRDHGRFVDDDDGILATPASIGAVERPEFDDTAVDQFQALFLFALLPNGRGQDAQQFSPDIPEEPISGTKPSHRFTLQSRLNQAIHPQHGLAPAAPAADYVEALGLLDQSHLRRVWRH